MYHCKLCYRGESENIQNYTVHKVFSLVKLNTQNESQLIKAIE